jgi:DNA-binding beta-propeller fold protein YncE
VVLVVLSGCASPDRAPAGPGPAFPGAGPAPAAPLPAPGPAAEPAEAPPTDRAPAGQVIPLGPGPEGLVADPVTGIVAAAVRDPARLVLLDGRGGGFRAEVALPGPLRHLQLAAPGGPVLVPVEAADQLVRVGLPDGRIIGTAATGDFPHDATQAANGQVFVADEFGGSVTVLDGERLVRRFEEPVQPGGIAAAGNLVGMIDVSRSTLTVYDAGGGTGGTRVAEVPAGAGPTHLVADRRGRLVVTDTRGDAVLVFELTPAPALRTVLPLPGQPYGIAYDPAGDRAWITLTGRNELVGLDLGAGPPREVVRLPTVRQPNTVAVDSSTARVFVASQTEGTLALVDPPR